jgi:hypothetical protein
MGVSARTIHAPAPAIVDLLEIIRGATVLCTA